MTTGPFVNCTQKLKNQVNVDVLCKHIFITTCSCNQLTLLLLTATGELHKIPAVGCHYVPPGLRLPSQPQSITAPWPVPSYTAW